MVVKRKGIKQESSSLDYKKRKQKDVKAQADIASAFAVQLLKSPKKRQKLEKRSEPEYIEIEDPIEGSSDEERSNRTQAALGSVHVSPRTFALPVTSQIRVVNGLNLIDGDVVSDHDLRIASSTLESLHPAERTSWVERIPLRRTVDLCVHKRKIADVQNWLESAFRRVVDSTVLILTGPAGSGKTATIEALSYELGFDIIEWKNPMSLEWKDASIERDADGLADQFERFLSISDKYSSLDFGQENCAPVGIHKHKVVLVEDIPNTFSSSSNNTSSAKLAFQNSIKRYLLSPRNKYPLILIITETEMRGEDVDGRRSDAMSVRNLMTRDILESPNCRQIQFNEVAPTFISKALTRLVDSLPRTEAIDVSQAVLDELARTSNGDIRSAINSLEFISHRFSTHGRSQKLRKKKKRGEILSLTEDENKILNIITNREAALGYFHAIGKVIYNKRIPTSLDPVPYDVLPAHLQSFARERPENDALAILDETSTDIPTFLLGIHQNYIDAAQHDVESIALASDCLSHADATTHGFRRDGAGGIVPNAVAAVTGVLTFLQRNATRSASTVPGPMSRATSQGARTGGSGAKIYFPQLGKLTKAQREVEDEIDRYIECLQTPRDHGDIPYNRSDDASRHLPHTSDARFLNPSNPEQQQQGYRLQDHADHQEHHKQQGQGSDSLVGTSVMRRTAVTELMPFHAQIKDRRARLRPNVQPSSRCQPQTHPVPTLEPLPGVQCRHQYPVVQQRRGPRDAASISQSHGHAHRYRDPKATAILHRHSDSNRGLLRAVTMNRFSTLGRGGVEQKETLLDDEDEKEEGEEEEDDHRRSAGGRDREDEGRTNVHGHDVEAGDRDRHGDANQRESGNSTQSEARRKNKQRSEGRQLNDGTEVKVEEIDGAAGGDGGINDIEDEIDDEIEEIA